MKNEEYDSKVTGLKELLSKEFLSEGWRAIRGWSWWLQLGVGVLMVGVIGLTATVTYVRLTYQRIFVGGAGGAVVSTQPSPQPSPSPPAPVYTIALLGHGDAGHDGALLTDSIMVVKVDTGNQTVGLISVPRDSWVKLPVEGWAADQQQHWKVNAAFAIGWSDALYPHKPPEFQASSYRHPAQAAGTLSKYALEQIVGFSIDYYVALDFSGFERTIDVLGGVPVTIPYAFEDPMYPLPDKQDDPCGKSEEEIEAMTATMSATQLEKAFECRYETLQFEPGYQVLSGETALKYVRSRHSPTAGGDFNRAARQRQILLAVRDRILAINFIPKIIPFINSLSANLKTDIPLSQIRDWIDDREEYLEYQIVGIPLTTADDNVLEITYSRDGQSILLPKERSAEDDWSAVHRYIEDQLQAVATTSGDI